MDTNTKSTPVGKPILHKDLSVSVYQTACLFKNPMLSHKKAIKRLGRYLLHTKKEGIIYNPDISKGLECYLDADFAGGWSREVGKTVCSDQSTNNPHTSVHTYEKKVPEATRKKIYMASNGQ